MNDAAPVQIAPHQLAALMKLTGIQNKIQLAKVCMTTPSGVGWYFTKGEMPLTRLKLLALKFHETVVEKCFDYTTEQVEMRKLLEARCGQDWKSIITDAKQIQTNLWRRMDKATHTHGIAHQSEDGKQANLSHVTLEQLSDEITSRGWTVNLTRKESTK